MVSIFHRGLFWRVYLTLLGSLMAVALLAATLAHWVLEQPMPGVSAPRAALSALLPPSAAPRAELESTLNRMSSGVGGWVVLTSPGGHVIAAARDGRIVPPQSLPGSIPSRGGAHARVLRVWRVRLLDGRSLTVETPSSLAAGGPHILAMLLAIAAAVGLAAYPIVSRLTGRLERLRSSLDAWGGGQLERRARVEGQDEIAAVAASFNAAADRVEALLAAHKALLAHASHELRSPLTRLRVAVEMFTATADPDLRPGIVRDIAELDGLVEEILLASQLDQAPGAQALEIVDCLALAAEEAARTGAQVSFVETGAGPFEVEGSARLLRRLIRNLIENAHKHGQPPVEVELARVDRRSGAWIVITVNDQGPGIAEAERERVFEPFYRPSGRAETAGSWGLGLSIVRQIAERHGGTVSCQPREGGAAFVAALPARQAG